MLEDQLQKLGLGKNEAQVYLALFDLGRAKAGKIIAHTGIHRNLVYASLEQLCQRRLIAQFVQHGVAVYVANRPESLLHALDEQRDIAKETVKALRRKQIKKPHEINVYEGIEGVVESRKASLALDAGDVAYLFGGSPLLYADEVSELWSEYRKRRTKKGIRLKMLCDKTVPQAYIDRKNKQPFCQARRLPMDVVVPAIFEMYGDVMNITVPGDEPVVFSLRSPEAAQGLKNYFDYFWQRAG